MSYQVLARKWRPSKFQEVIGQDHITRSLQNSIKSKKIAHAYLFTGTRGVGKTSIARIFAKAIRCTNLTSDFNPCLKCQSCLDIDLQNSMDYVEIDGASNNSVDNVRSLIENVAYLPTSGTYKIYVIDEVHMLSVSAFNALLKTLEEPPAHVVFMFATTDPHKLLGTVLSRVQRLDFKFVPIPTLEKHLLNISEKEAIKFEPMSLVSQLADIAHGSVRDSLSLLDQILALTPDQKITDEIFSLSLGLVGNKVLKDLFNCMLDENPNQTHEIFSKISSQNIDLSKFNQQLLSLIYKVIQGMDENSPEYKKTFDEFPALTSLSFAEIFWIFESYSRDIVWAMNSPFPSMTIDLMLQKIARRRQILKPDAAHIKSTPQRATTVEQKKNNIILEKKVSFLDFLMTLNTNAPSIKGQLERGALIHEQKSGNKLIVTYGFDKENIDAKEYLESADILKKLKLLFSQFSRIGADDFEIKWQILESTEVENLSFISYNDQNESKLKKEEEFKKDKLLNDPYIKEAERLFNSKIDKIILKTE